MFLIFNSKLIDSMKTGFNKYRFSLEILTAVLALVAILVSCSANKTANEANSISNEANKIALGAYNLEKSSRSHDICTQAFDELDQGNRALVMEKLRNGELIQDELNLRRVMNTFEWVGDAFCRGDVYHDDIGSQLRILLSRICNNQQVYNFYKGRFNATAILCNDFHPNSMFAKTLDKSNIDTCNFLD